MRKDDTTKFLAAVFFTMGLMALLVFSQHRLEVAANRGPVVDMIKINNMVQSGQLSMHPAEFYKAVEQRK